MLFAKSRSSGVSGIYPRREAWIGALGTYSGRHYQSRFSLYLM